MGLLPAPCAAPNCSLLRWGTERSLMPYKHCSAVTKEFPCFRSIFRTNPKHSSIQTYKKINSIPTKTSTIYHRESGYQRTKYEYAARKPLRFNLALHFLNFLPIQFVEKYFASVIKDYSEEHNGI